MVNEKSQDSKYQAFHSNRRAGWSIMGKHSEDGSPAGECRAEIEGERKGGVLSTSISSCSSPAGREGDISLISKQNSGSPPGLRLSTAHSSSEDSSLLGSVGEKVTTPEEVSYRKEVHGFVPPSAGKL